jgi:hypothetical protein
MAQDNTAGLATMLSFLQQGSNPGQDQLLPEMQQPQPMPQISLPQSHKGGGGVLMGILGNLASSYVSNKLQTHMDKAAAEETAAAYGPMAKDLADSAATPQDKAAYGYFSKLINSGNPTAVGQGIEGIKARHLEAAKLTQTQRELQDPQLAPGILRKTATEGMSDTGKKMWEQYPQLQQGSQEYADKASTLMRMGSPWDSGQMVPASADEIRAWGGDPTVPHTKNNKTGEVVAHPIQITQDQGQSGLLMGSLEQSLSGMREALKSYDLKIPANPKDFAADMASKAGGVWGVGNAIEAAGNSSMSDELRLFNTHAAAAESAIFHLLSGAGGSEEEARRKAKAMKPGWGDDDKTKTAKFGFIENLLKNGVVRAGPAMPGALERRSGKTTTPAPTTPPKDTSYVDPASVKFPDNFTPEMKAQYLKELDDYNKSGGK